MSRIFKLFALVSLGAYIAARLRRRTSAPTHTDAPEVRGIADVDPEALTQFGEAIDPEAIRNAHAEPALLPEQRGKNLP